MTFGQNLKYEEIKKLVIDINGFKKKKKLKYGEVQARYNEIWKKVKGNDEAINSKIKELKITRTIAKNKSQENSVLFRMCQRASVNKATTTTTTTTTKSTTTTTNTTITTPTATTAIAIASPLTVDQENKDPNIKALLLRQKAPQQEAVKEKITTLELEIHKINQGKERYDAAVRLGKETNNFTSLWNPAVELQYNQFVKEKKTFTQKLHNLQLNQNRQQKCRAKRRDLLISKGIHNMRNYKVVRGAPTKFAGMEDEFEAAVMSIVAAFISADGKRRTEINNVSCTLNNLHDGLKELGFNFSRSGLYLRIQPRDSNSIEGRRHLNALPITFKKPDNTARKLHIDQYFARACTDYLKQLACLLGSEYVMVLSCDDKANVPIGITASKCKMVGLIGLEYKVQLPDHDFVIAAGHKLIPSVYAPLLIDNKNKKLTYNGPTKIKIRSLKHDSSTAFSHGRDIKELLDDDEYKEFTRCEDGKVKSILFHLVDGGPDESPRSPKTLRMAYQLFKKYDLDAIYIATEAPGRSAYNIVER
eukprot:Pgem_evm1s1604